MGETGARQGAVLRGGSVSPQSLSAICLPSQVFPPDSPPRPKRRCEAFMNEFPEVLGRTECEYPFDVCCSVCPAAHYVCAQFHREQNKVISHNMEIILKKFP